MNGKRILDLLIANVKVVKHYPYRTGLIYLEDQLDRIDYERNSPLERLHEQLARQAGFNHIDNHECFDVVVDGNSYSLRFSDWHVTLGTKVRKQDH